MSEVNPYKLLRVPRNANTGVIEDAYNRLYDQYEEAAEAGDQEAIDILWEIDEARRILLSPSKRAVLDSTLPPPVNRPAGTRTRPTTGAAMQASSSRPSRTAPIAERRPRSVPTRPARSPLPLVAGGIALVGLVLIAIFFISRNNSTGNTASNGEVVATVNGQPIYRSDYQDRLERDKTAAQNDPLFAGLINNFEGITGTRMLDVLSYDALDKLINMQVIQQEAKKEGLFPTDAQQTGLVDQAKTTDLTTQTFDEFLKSHNITEAQYTRNVIANVVYAVMANKYRPSTGTTDARNNAFITWMCNARKQYDVKIMLKFIVENQPCSSGLPSDIPLDEGGLAPPEPLPTGAASPVPQATPTAKP